MNYKHIYLLLIIAVCVHFSHMAKSQDNSSIKFMPQAGLNLTQLSDSPITNSDKFRTGFEMGLFVNTDQLVFFQPGVFYAQQGLKRMAISETTTDSILNNIDYSMLKVPITFGLKFLNVRLYTGPCFSFFLNSDNSTMTADEFRKIHIGLTTGGGIHLLHMTFDIRYEYGISDIFTYRDASANTLTFSVGLRF